MYFIRIPANKICGIVKILAFGFAACDPTNPCTLHPIWSKMQECIQEWAGDSTLADLGPGPTTPRTRKAT